MSFEFDSQFDLIRTVNVKIIVSGYDQKFPPTNIINNDNFDPVKRWMISENGSGAWIDFQLDQDLTIYGVDIAWYKGNERKQTFKILSSNSPTMLWHGANTGSLGSYETYKFNNPIRASNIRIICLGNSDGDETVSISSIKFKLEPIDGDSVPPFPTCPPGQHWHDALQRCVDDMITRPPEVIISEPIQTVKHGDRVILDGSQSIDPSGSRIFFEWTQTSGESVIISNPLQPNILFTAPTVDTTLTFRLTVKNEANLSASADAEVIVKSLIPTCPPGQHYDPIANKCVDDELGCPELPDDGRNQFHKGADLDATLWTIVQMRDDPNLLKIVDSNGINVADMFHSEPNAHQFIAHYICEPVVIPPMAKIVPETQTVDGFTSVILDGSESSGTGITYEWTQTAGQPGVSISDSNQPVASFIAPPAQDENNILTFRLIITNINGETDKSDTWITIRGTNQSTETPYPVIGKPLESTQRGPTKRNYASGKPSDWTIEKNVKNIRFKNYQFVVDITNDCEWAHDDTFSMKLGGTHMGSGWFDHGVGIFDGQTCLGKEEDHPHTDLCVITGPKLGDTRGKRFKIAATYFTDINKTELWTNFGDGWKKQIEGTDVGGFRPNSSQDECQLRIDGFKTLNDPPSIHSAFVTEI